MKNKTNIRNIQEKDTKNKNKIIKKMQNSFFFTRKDIGMQSEKIKNEFQSRKDKLNFTTITNNNNLKNPKDIKPKYLRKNISLACTNLNSFLNTDKINQREKSKSKIKTKYIKKIKENIGTLNISKKNIILNNLQKGKEKKYNPDYNNCFSGKKKISPFSNMFKSLNTSFIYTDYKQRNTNDNFKSFIKHIDNNNDSNKKNPIKIDLNNYYKNLNSLKPNKNIRNKSYLNKLYPGANFSKKEKKYIVKNSKNINNINMNMNNSSKLTNISSYVASEKNINSKKSLTNNIDLIKEKILILFKSDLKEKESQDLESKFLNYELGLSDKVSTINNNFLDDNIIYQNKNVKYEECEKSFEEIEKIAKEIYNSEYKNKIKSFFNHRKKKENNSYISKDIGLNNDIEELKDGEEIQNVLALYVNIKKK
jgi:hypothetical protein